MWFNHFHQYSIFGPQIWSPFGFGIFGSVLFLIAAAWILFVVVLKGYALWHSAKRGQVWWFIALLVFNTLGILELIYIVFLLKKWPGKAETTGHGHGHEVGGQDQKFSKSLEHEHDRTHKSS